MLRRVGMLVVILVAVVACTPAPAPPPPAVSGDAEVGATLTVSNGGWLFAPQSFAYGWESCASPGSGCVDVGTDASSYLVELSDVGRFIRATVTATNAAGQAFAVSGSVGPIASCPILTQGNWSGSWSSILGVGGLASATVATSGSTVSGTIELTGSVLPGGPYTGTIDCSAATISRTDGTIEVSGTISPDGQQITGTYVASLPGGGTDTGSVTLSAS